MDFQKTYPTITLLIGKTKVVILEQHAENLCKNPGENARNHFKECLLPDWCALNSTPEFRDKLGRIEWCLTHILASQDIDETKLKRAFADKAINPNQFGQLLGEITTAAVCAKKAKLLNLEWKTGKGDRDADVRAEICGEPVNLEVTLRTDSWAEEVAFYSEDYLDKDGNQIAESPAAKSRRTLTDRQCDDLHGAGLTKPKRVSEVIEERRNKPRKMTYYSGDGEIPEEPEQRAFCADGDNKNVESITLQDRISEKASKFNADGFHIVVLATLKPGFPSENSVFDAVFGQMPQIKHHGIFENDLNNEICGVLFLPVYQQMFRLKGDHEVDSRAAFFPNHNAKCKLSRKLESQIAEVFEAKIRRGWISA